MLTSELHCVEELFPLNHLPAHSLLLLTQMAAHYNQPLDLQVHICGFNQMWVENIYDAYPKLSHQY